MLKNTASQYIAFNAVSSADGSAITTGTPVVHITIDGGTQATSTNTAVHEGNGQWSLALTQAETNGSHIVYSMVLTSAINSMVQAYPVTLSDFMADVSSLATSAEISALNDFDPASDQVIVGTNNDKVDISGLATSADISALNNFDPSSDQVIVGTNNDKFNYSLTSADINAIVDSVWDESLSAHNFAGSTGKALRQLKDGVISTEGEVSSGSTTTVIQTNLISSVNDFYNDLTIAFTGGSLEGQSRVVTDYDGASGAITVEEPLTSAPSSGDDFIILTAHVHPVSSIVEGVWDEPQSGHTTVGTFGYYLDDQVSAAGGGGGTAPTEAEMYTYFTSASREDAFKADVSALSLESTSQSIVSDTNELQTNQNNWLTATGFNTVAPDNAGIAANGVAIAALNDFNPAVDTVAHVTLVDTTTDLTNGGGGTAPTEAEMYTYFTAASREDAFKADVSALALESTVQGISSDVAALDILLTTIVVVNQVAMALDLDDVKVVTDKLDTTLETDGSGGYQFTELSLENAPTGSGGGSGDWTATEKNQIRYRLGVDGTSSTPLAYASLVSEIWDEQQSSHTSAGSFGYYLDAQVSAAGGGGGTSDWTVIEKEEIRYRLGIDGNTNVPSTNNPDLARNTTAQTVIDALTVEIDGLNDFNPAVDTVARVTLVDTTTTNTDMVDVSGLATSFEIATLNNVSSEEVYLYFTDGVREDAFKADVSGLASQASIAALNDFNPAVDTVARVTLVDTTTTNTDMVDVSGLALEASVQGLNDISASDVYTLFTTGSNADQFKADTTLLATAASIAALNDFNPAVDTVAHVTLVDTTTTNTDMVDVSGLASQASVDALNNITVQQVVDGVWDEQQSLHVSAGSFGAYLDGQVTAAGGDDAATIYSFFTAGSNEDAFKANVSGLATQTSVDALPTAGDIYTQFVAGTNADAFKADISLLALQTTLTSLNDLSASQVESAVWDAVQTSHTTAGTFGFYLDSTVSTAGGGSMTPSDIYDYFTDLTRADEFKADVSGLAQEASVTALPSAAETYTYFTTGNRPDPFHADITALATASQITALNDFNPSADIVSRVTLVDTTTTNVDMVDISGLATTVRIDQLNDFNPATDVVMNVDTVQNVVNIGQGLNGPSVLTVTVSDGSNPIENAQVVAKRTGESGFKVTDSNGQVQFAVSDATYDLVVISAGYEGVVDSVVVSGATGKAITMSATVLPTPSQPELCVVACYIQLNGQPVENAVVRATLVNSNSAIDGIVLSNSKDVAETNIDGYAQLELIRLDQFVDGNGQYLIEVFDGNNKLWSTTSTIPNTGAVNLEDLV